VPGYGLAVAQAQHSLIGAARLLEQHGVAVSYASTPVRPDAGHMNVPAGRGRCALRPADEMDVINPDFPRTDVVSFWAPTTWSTPAPKRSAQPPVAACPCWRSTGPLVFVVKRSLGSGYAASARPVEPAPDLNGVGDPKQVLAGLIQPCANFAVGKVPCLRKGVSLPSGGCQDRPAADSAAQDEGCTSAGLLAFAYFASLPANCGPRHGATTPIRAAHHHPDQQTPTPWNGLGGGDAGPRGEKHSMLAISDGISHGDAPESLPVDAVSGLLQF